MIILNNFKNAFIDKSIIFVLLVVFLVIFYLEYLYLLPSPTGDDLWFLKLSFNICRDNQFVATNHSIFETNAEAIKWTTHGWFNQYVMAKLNIDCSLRGIFVFNFFIKILSSILIYLTLKQKNINFIYIYFLILLTLAVQLKLQFRPETFTIFLYLLLIYNFFNKNFFTVGLLQALIFFTQPTIFVLITLFGLIIYYRDFIDNFHKIILGFFLSSTLLLYIYPYSIFSYISGLWAHKSALEGSYTLLDGGFNQTYFQNIKTYYIKTNFLPFFGFLFLFIYSFLIKKKKFLLITIPFIFYFGPNAPSANHVLISLIPFLLILLICSQDLKKFDTKYLHYLFSLVLIVSTLGLSQYFLRNILTSIQYGDELEKSKKFLLQNKDQIILYPGFSFMVDNNFKFISAGSKNIDTTNLNLKIYSTNGSRNPCIENNTYNNNIHHIEIFSKKIFNSNSGYGIWICD